MALLSIIHRHLKRLRLVPGRRNRGRLLANGIDLKSLWPLEAGNTTTNTVTVVGRDGKSYTSTVTMLVVASEKVTVGRS